MHTVQTLEGADGMPVDISSVTEALSQEGQIIITGEDGHGNLIHFAVSL